MEKDFLTYVEGKGQEIVGENYQTVKKTTTFLSGKPKGTIKIGGSSSVASLMQELSDAYMQINPNAEITVVTTDSTNGLTGAMSGIYDLGMASRELKDYEKELLDYDVIAKDEEVSKLCNIKRLRYSATYTIRKHRCILQGC